MASSKTTSWILELIDKITAPLNSIQRSADDAAKSTEKLDRQLDDVEKRGSGKGLVNIGEQIGKTAFLFNQVSGAVGGANSEFQKAIAPGVAFQNELAEVSAITHKAGKDLEDIGNRAKDLAKEFGWSAPKYVESFKNIIGALGDGIADDSEALAGMGKNVAILSKSMGGDAVGASKALTTALLQYGVDLSNPMAATKEMERMMNIMAAGAAAGSSEVIDTAEAMKTSGLIARQMGIPFEDFVATLEGLGKGMITGSEAGTHMRSLLTTISTMGSATKQAKEYMKAYGVDMKLVSDPTVKLTDKIRELSKIQGSSDAMKAVFDERYISSASVLMENVDLIDEYSASIKDTNEAVDAANIVMDTFSGKMSKIYARVDNLKIDFFNLSESVAPFITVAGSAMESVTNLGIAVWGLSILFKKELYVGIWKGITAMFSWINVNNIAKIATLATTVASWLFNLSLWANPITWVVAGIMLAVGAFVLLWNKCEGFRAVITGLWEVIKGFGNIIKEFIIDRVTGFISGIGSLADALMKLFKGDFKGAWASAKEGANGILGIDAMANAAKNTYNYSKNIGETFSQGYADGKKAYEIAHSQEITEKEPFTIYQPGKKSAENPTKRIDGNNGSKDISTNNKKEKSLNLAGGSGGSGGGKSITMNITLQNHFSGGNAQEIADKIFRQLNDRITDTLKAA